MNKFNKDMLEEVNCMSLPQLKKMAKDRKITGRAKKNRVALKALIYDDIMGDGVEAQGGQSVSDSIGEDFDLKINALNAMSVKQLREVARDMKIKGRAKKKACDLQNMILGEMNNMIKSAVKIPQSVKPELKKLEAELKEAKPTPQLSINTGGDGVTMRAVKAAMRKPVKSRLKPVKSTPDDVGSDAPPVPAPEKKTKVAPKVKKTDPLKSTKDWIKKTNPVLVIGPTEDGDGFIVDTLLKSFGDPDSTFIFLGPDVNDKMRISDLDQKLLKVGYNELPNLGKKFDLIVVLGEGSDNLGRCAAMKKYSNKESQFIINLDGLKGCTSTKKKLKLVEMSTQSGFESYGVYNNS